MGWQTIYRVEHKQCRQGPYIGHYDCDHFDLSSEICDAHSGYRMMKTHPNPFRDGLGEWFDEDWFCGFRSLDDLYRWFDGWFELLDRDGFVIAEYLIYRNVKHGRRQSIFKKTSRQPDLKRITDVFAERLAERMI